MSWQLPSMAITALRLTPIVPLVAALAGSAGAQPIEVDVELVLMVDVSRSMGPEEIRIQRRGYAEALASDEVADAIAELLAFLAILKD